MLIIVKSKNNNNRKPSVSSRHCHAALQTCWQLNVQCMIWKRNKLKEGDSYLRTIMLSSWVDITSNWLQNANHPTCHYSVCYNCAPTEVSPHTFLVFKVKLLMGGFWNSDPQTLCVTLVRIKSARGDKGSEIDTVMFHFYREVLHTHNFFHAR